MTEKTCRRCDHSIYQSTGRLCLAEQTRIPDLVEGGYMNPLCRDARGNEKSCGQEGKYFMPIPSRHAGAEPDSLV